MEGLVCGGEAGWHSMRTAMELPETHRGSECDHPLGEGRVFTER